MDRRFFRAPWSKTLKITSLFVLGVLLIGVFVSGPAGAALLGVLLIGSLLLIVTGYSVQDGKMVVNGLLWRKSFDLADLEGLLYEPGITAGSIRTFGSGGLFSSLGYFSNNLLGSYLGFMTEPQNAVVLEFRDRLVVVTPENPEEFCKAVHSEQKHHRLSPGGQG